MRKLPLLTAAFFVIFLFIGMNSYAALKTYLPYNKENSSISSVSNPLELITNKIPIGSCTDLSDWSTVFSIDKTTHHVGNASFKITNDIVGTSYIIIPVVGLESSRYYRLETFIKTANINGINGGAYTKIELYDIPENPTKNIETYKIYSSEFPSYLVKANDWKCTGIVFKTPEKHFTHALVLFGLSNSAGTAWFDRPFIKDGQADGPTLLTPTPTQSATPAPVAGASEWARAEVGTAIANHLIPVHLQSKYTSNITRSDFCDLAVNLIEVRSGKKIADFVRQKTGKNLSDKPFPDTASVNVNAANKLGIVNGRTNGNFDPTGLITRQEAAKMLALTAKALGTDITSEDAGFADSAAIAAWARESVNFVFAKGIMIGTGQNKFSPAGNYTREQSIVTILRLYRVLK